MRRLRHDQDGVQTDNRTNFFSYTGDASGTATVQLTRAISSRTSVGLQYLKTVFDRNGAFAETSLRRDHGGRWGDAARERGDGHQQNVRRVYRGARRIKERLFVTGALRVDDNSAFGAPLQVGILPEAQR